MYFIIIDCYYSFSNRKKNAQKRLVLSSGARRTFWLLSRTSKITFDSSKKKNYNLSWYMAFKNTNMYKK